MVNINLKYGMVLFAQPVIDPLTPGGVAKLDSQIKKEQQEVSFLPQPVLAIADGIEGIKVGDYAYIRPHSQPEHLIIQGTTYVAFSQGDVLGTVKHIENYLAWKADEDAQKAEKQKETLSKLKGVSKII